MNEISGWRGFWLGCLGLCLALVLVLVWTIFPARSQLEAEHLRKAATVMKSIDRSLAKLDAVQIKSHYAGMPYADAMSALRDKLDRLHPSWTSYAEGGAHIFQVGNNAKGPGVANTLVWFDGDVQITPAALAKAKVEFERLGTSYQRKLDRLPAKRLEAVASGFLLVLLPMGLLFIFGIVVEGADNMRSDRPTMLARAFASLRGSTPLAQHLDIQTLDLAAIRR